MKNTLVVIPGRKICAGCGVEIRPEWIIDDIICSACKDKMGGKDLSWTDIVFNRNLHEEYGNVHGGFQD